MKKETILEALKNAGVELEEDKLKGFIKEIQVANGVDIELAKKDYADKENEIAELKAKYDIKQKELDNYNDEEIAELRKFKENTIAEKQKAVRESALKSLIGKEDYKFDKKAIDLLTAVASQSATFNDNNEITNSEELINGLTEKYKDFIVTTTEDGANPQSEKNQNNINLQDMDFEQYKEYRKKNK